jgi:hypothetical protein
VLGPDFARRWGFCLVPCRICITLSGFAPFAYFPLVSNTCPTKHDFLQYKWNYVNSKGIYVKRLFISPVLDFIWWSDSIESDRQQGPDPPLGKRWGSDPRPHARHRARWAALAAVVGRRGRRGAAGVRGRRGTAMVGARRAAGVVGVRGKRG